MGLDMWFDADIYLGANYEHRRIRGSVDIWREGEDGIKTPIPIERDEISSISIRVGYWRKANAIHAWFTDNVADGVDECQEVRVQHGYIRELEADIKAVLENHDLAPELIPTRRGFFFGGTSYDRYYFDDLEHTLKIITKAKQLIKLHKHNISFIYQSSW